MAARVLAACLLASLAAASLRGGAPLDAAVGDVENQLATVVGEITAQAKKFDCATAGTQVTDMMKQVQDKIAQRRDGLAAKCAGRKAAVDAALEADKAKHAQGMAEEVKNLTAIMRKTMAPLEKVLAETRGEHQAKVDRATTENITAWKALKKDRNTFANLTAKLDAANAAYAKTKNQTKAVFEAEKAEAAEAREAAFKEAQDSFDLKQKNINKAKKRGQSRCFNETNQERELNKQHKDLIDKVLPLVKALKDCKAGKAATQAQATAAATDGAVNAFLEKGDECKELSSELSGHFTGGSQGVFLELIAKQADPVQAIVDRVNANISSTTDKHQACLAEHSKVVDAMLAKATAALQAAQGNATAAEAERNEKAAEVKQTIDNKALAKVDAVQAGITKTLESLGAAHADSGDEDDGSIALARRKRRHLKVALEEQAAAVAKAMNMVKEAQDREDEALAQEKERLDGERTDADKTSEAMAVAAKSGIKASCNEEAAVLAEEAKAADESEMKLFSIVAKIDPNADKVVTTTPKPVVLPQPIAKTDGTAVTSYQLVAATKVAGTCEAAGMAAVAKEELNSSESVCNMVKDSFNGGIIVASVTAPKFNALSGATLTTFNPSTCKTNEPFVTSFTYKEMEAKLEANVGKKMHYVCKTVTAGTN